MWDRIVPTGPQSELRQLLQLLEELLVGYDLEILEGKGYVEAAQVQMVVEKADLQKLYKLRISFAILRVLHFT